jgi:hypothetical protein
MADSTVDRREVLGAVAGMLTAGCADGRNVDPDNRVTDNPLESPTEEENNGGNSPTATAAQDAEIPAEWEELLNFYPSATASSVEAEDILLALRPSQAYSKLDGDLAENYQTHQESPGTCPVMSLIGIENAEKRVDVRGNVIETSKTGEMESALQEIDYEQVDSIGDFAIYDTDADYDPDDSALSVQHGNAVFAIGKDIVVDGLDMSGLEATINAGLDNIDRRVDEDDNVRILSSGIEGEFYRANPENSKQNDAATAYSHKINGDTTTRTDYIVEDGELVETGSETLPNSEAW